MKSDFWLERWQEGQIGFHQEHFNPQLIKFFPKLNSPLRILVPLCGKSKDMIWLLEKGLYVIGVELSEIAVKAFFKENQIPFQIKVIGKFKAYLGENCTIYCGDFFNLTEKMIEKCDAIYDRASLIALPPNMRKQHIQHKIKINACIPTLLLAIEYEQDKVDGPPFSVPQVEVEQLYIERKIELLETMEVPQLPKKMFEAGVSLTQKIYLISGRPTE